MLQQRQSTFRILHCALCIALVALCATSARADWYYDISAKTLTEQGVAGGETAWVFNCTVVGQNLTLASVKTAGTSTNLNFRTAIEASNGGTYAITALGNNLFNANADITSVRLPDTLTTIGGFCFQNCTSLRRVTPFLPETVTSIGCAAFRNAPVEGSLRIGFGGTVTWGTGNNGNAWTFEGTAITEIIAGPGVHSVGTYFCDGSATLTNVVFAETGLTSIGSYAFYGCTLLRRITPFLPDTVTYVGCSSFKNAPVEGVLRLGYGGTMSWGTGNNGNGWPFEATAISELDAGPGVKILPTYFAYNCTHLTNVVFAPSGLTTIGACAFEGCTLLRRVTPFLPDTVTRLGARVFYGVPVENALRIGYGGPLTLDGADSGRGRQFQGSGLTSMTAGPGVTSVRAYFAINCAHLTNVVFDGTEQVSLADNSFGSCPLLTNVVLRPVATWTTSSFASTPPDYYGRILYYKTNAEWNDAIASYGTSFKNWDGDVTDAEKAIYQTAFPDGPTPRGYMAVSKIKKWFVPITGGEEGTVGACVTASPYEVGTPSPEYTNMTSVSIPAAFSVSQYGEREGVAYESTGYRLDAMGEETWIVGEPVAGVRSFTIDDAQTDTYRVTWQWREAGYRLTVHVPPTGLCSVSVSGTELTDPSLTGVYYVSNTVVTLTATPAGGRRFVRWYGDVPEEQADSATIHLTMDRVRTVIPYVEEGWTYVEAGKTITDGYWVLNVTGSASGHTISSVNDSSDASACLDLRKATDGFSFAQIGTSAFADVESLREVLLPDTLTTIGACAFSGCHSLKAVTPFLPETVTSIGWGAFQNCTSLTGALRLGFGGPLTFGGGNSGFGGTFANTAIVELVAGPGVTMIRAFGFNLCASLTNVVFEQTGLTSIGGYAFQDCTSLRRVTPFLPDTVTDVGCAAFQNAPVEGVLRVGFGGAVTWGTGNNGNAWTFEGTAISEIIAGPGVHSLGTYFCDGSTTLTNVVFAEAGLTSIGNCAFQDCTSLRRVTPFLPDTVTYVGCAAFQNAPVEGTLRVGFGGAVTWNTGTNGNAWTFEGTAISKLIAGPGVSSFGTYCFNSCASLAEADLTESTGLTSIREVAFANAPSLLDVWLNAYPTFGKNAFSGVPANARFHLAKDVESWTTWLDNTANAKPWAALTAAEKEVYNDFWGAAARRPKARAAKSLSPFPKDSWLLRYSTDRQTMIILR